MPTQQQPVLPPELVRIQDAARKALQEVEPAGPPRSDTEGRGLILSARTNGGRELPAYYLVYFLLIDLLAYPSLGQWEKTAWAVPVRYRGRLYVIEHRKMGLGIFAPNLDPMAITSGTPSELAEDDARAIAVRIKAATSVAEPYFEWRAEQAVATSELNVVNRTSSLFRRYEHFRDRSQILFAEAERREDERETETTTAPGGLTSTTVRYPSGTLRREANWLAQAAIEAFFSWTEHAFIHLAILKGKLRSGTEVAEAAAADWKVKFKHALDIADAETKQHYDNLLDLRAQVRNLVAHGAFGKRGEAFSFHSGAGAAPVLLTDNQRHRFSLTGRTAFDERQSLLQIEQFLQHLWAGPHAPARHYMFSDLPSILTFTVDGTYTRAMSSEDEMKTFIHHLCAQIDRAANMDW